MQTNSLFFHILYCRRHPRRCNVNDFGIFSRPRPPVSCSETLVPWRRLLSTTNTNNNPSTIIKNDRDLMHYPPELIRNFSIIAHIDHGKSTLADRLLELTGTIDKSANNKQVMDKLKVERERGITVKAQTASMFYPYNGKLYLLNLIDTPGHADFSYEVSRSLAACQGTLLLVDAAQGIQAQTVANFYLAFGEDLAILPVLNKIDLPQADPEKVTDQIKSVFEIESKPICISAKSGLNIDAILPAVIENIPPPVASREKCFRGLLFDSWYDKYVGVICLMAIGDGKLSKGDKISSAHTGLTYEVSELGIMYPEQTPTPALYAGQVGYVVLGMKTVRDANIGDTFHPHSTPLSQIKLFPNFEPAKSKVFSGLYPMDGNEYHKLQDALDRLTLNDASVSVVKESSAALGQGFRVGFLGRLHMDVFRQRLEEEHSSTVINTAPTVPYKFKRFCPRSKTMIEETIKNPADFPEGDALARVETFMEPMVLATVIFPAEYTGAMMELCSNHRGEQIDCNYLDANRAIMKYKLPMAEILTEFHDQMKSRSSGYASFDYEEIGYSESSDLVKVNFLLNTVPVDALTAVVHRSQADRVARNGVKKLKEVMERELFEVVIQGTIGSRVVARDTIRALRKDVTAKCYGGDVTRRMKLLQRQKEGKKRMKSLSGGVRLPQEAFLSLMER